LTTRNIIYHDSQVCMTGCGGFETSWHLFLLETTSTRIGIFSADMKLLHDHLV
jgi:hypothetical protein